MSTSTLSANEPLNRQLLQGPILKSIWSLALPAMGVSGVQIGFDLMHAAWVGHLGPEPLAALTAASFIVWILYSLTAMLTTGITALLARRLGEGLPEQAREIAWQGFCLSLIFGLLLGWFRLGNWKRHQV